jgi:hypothetical protein
MTEAAPQDAPETPEAAPEPAPLPWAEVNAEHFQLLRLAPLPTDRNSGARPLRFVQYGYAERHNKDTSLLRMVIQLPGQKVRKEQNHLDIWVDHQEKRVHIGPESGLQIEPLNRGLGRFLLSQAVSWAQRKWAHYRVDGAALANKDALNEDTRLRRDQHLKGRYIEVQVGELKGGWNADKVQRIEILDAAHMLQQAEQNLQEKEAQLRERDERVSKYRREDSGLRFTITCLVAFAVFQAGLLIWIATH